MPACSGSTIRERNSQFAANAGAVPGAVIFGDGKTHPFARVVFTFFGGTHDVRSLVRSQVRSIGVPRQFC